MEGDEAMEEVEGFELIGSLAWKALKAINQQRKCAGRETGFAQREGPERTPVVSRPAIAREQRENHSAQSG